MLRRTYESQDCPVARALEVIGERWTLLIVRDALRGTTRFGEFRCRLDITASVLANRLDRLVSAGVLQRKVYQTRPDRYAYQLTPQGRELATVILALTRWGERHLYPLDAAPKAVYHDGCGGRVEPQLVCGTCRAAVPARAVLPYPPARRSDPAGQHR